MGVTNQSVSKWESAQCCPDIQLLPVIAELFNVSVDELIGYKAAKTSEPNTDSCWNTDKVVEQAGKTGWDYSCCNIPELSTMMRNSAVFFSDNKNLDIKNMDIRRITSMIKPFGDANNLKVSVALYQLTVHSEDAYVTVETISEKANLSVEKVEECLENELA